MVVLHRSKGIISISLGQTRTLRVGDATRTASGEYSQVKQWTTVELDNGCIVFMMPGIQSNTVHQVPVNPQCRGERINITGRYGKV